MKTGKIKSIIISSVITLIYLIIAFYITLPPVNLQAPEFYIFLLSIAAVFCAVYFICSMVKNAKSFTANNHSYNMAFDTNSLKKYKIPFLICGIFAAVLIIGGIISSPFINSGKYQKLITVEEGDFAQDVAEINYSQIPTLDKESAKKLGNRKMGELADLVSQFEVSDMYTQVNYRSVPTRVTPLLYGDFFKWLNNRSAGIPAYMRLDMVTQEITCVKLEEGIKYSESEYFNRNIKRHLRFKYPTFIFDDPVFEIDEEGNPYWVCAKIKKTIGLFGGKNVDGVVLCNAVTGECEYYKASEIPSWVDRAYSAELLIEQYDYHGLYVNGFWNSIFGQKGAKVTTEGYNYIAINDDVYVYTGVTSIGGDESNIGFVLMNQRTKETKFYPVAGAEEYSAMDSAEGQVQHLNYTATFPLLLNIEGEPTYFIPLKDAAGLVKKYSMVNVAKYQNVAIGDTIKECESQYKQLLEIGENNDGENKVPAVTVKTIGIIIKKESAVIQGDTYYYISIDESDKVFRISAAENEKAVMLGIGDNVEIEYEEKTDEIIKIVSIVKK